MGTQTFRLNLFDTTREWRLGLSLILGMSAALGVSLWVGKAMEPGWPAVLGWLGTVATGCYAVSRAYKRAAVVPAVVTVTPTELRVEDLRANPRLSQIVRLADITTCRRYYLSSSAVLRLNQAGSLLLKLQSAGWQTSATTFSAMCAAIEQAIEAIHPSETCRDNARNV